MVIYKSYTNINWDWTLDYIIVGFLCCVTQRSMWRGKIMTRFTPVFAILASFTPEEKETLILHHQFSTMTKLPTVRAQLIYFKWGSSMAAHKMYWAWLCGIVWYKVWLDACPDTIVHQWGLLHTSNLVHYAKINYLG